MMRKIIIYIFFAFLAVSVSSQTKFSVGAGTIFGGAINNENVENATGVPMFGASIDFAYRNAVKDNFTISPKISYEHRTFEYAANERKDTLVYTEVMGNTVGVPTYYQAIINGKLNSGGITLNLISEYRFLRKSSFIVGIYSTLFMYKNDYVDINIRIGEGGLLPDIDSSYNNGLNLRRFEHGLSLGGKYHVSEQFSVSIVGTRALSSLYSISGITNDNGEEIRFYSTYAKIFLNYYF